MTSTDEARDTAALLIAVTESTRHAFETVCASFDLTVPQARAVLALEQDAPMRGLAEHLRCDASNITGIADRLEARGIVARTTRTGDRRVKLLALTPEGRRLRDAMAEAVAAASPVMTALDGDERALLRDLLLKASSASRRAR